SFLAASSFLVIISLNSIRSESEYLIVGPVCSCIGVSNTDLVNSGSYFTAVRVVVFGITTFVGRGGSFFTTGFAVGLMDTSDFGSTSPLFLAAGLAGAGVADFTSGFAGAFLTGAFAAGFEAALAAGFEAGLAVFTGLVAFAALTGLDADFFAGAAFLAGAGFFDEADFFVGTDFTFFLGAARSEEHTSELQSRENLVCRLP